jgi:hypothetical protein
MARKGPGRSHRRRSLVSRGPSGSTPACLGWRENCGASSPFSRRPLPGSAQRPMRADDQSPPEIVRGAHLIASEAAGVGRRPGSNSGGATGVITSSARVEHPITINGGRFSDVAQEETHVWITIRPSAGRPGRPSGSIRKQRPGELGRYPRRDRFRPSGGGGGIPHSSGRPTGQGIRLVDHPPRAPDSYHYRAASLG